MMKIMAEGVIDIAANLKTVQAVMTDAVAARPNQATDKMPTLVAVSKKKSVLMIKGAYDAGQRHFGENYVKELLYKAKDVDLAKLCPDIKWHFIGHLQKNKISQLMNCPRLHMVETISSYEVADSFQKKMKSDLTLNAMIQVNTSGEERKSGILPEQCADFAQHIVEKCPKLILRGVMTIGKPEHDYLCGPNPDFECLIKCRESISEHLNIPVNELDLSMGMSADFKEAIIAGSSHIRVGSTIFGKREN